MSKRILRMRVENFLSFGEADFDFEDAGFVLVEGENGCLSGDTLIDVPRDLKRHPLGIPLRDLVGSTPFVYAWQNGRIVVKKAEKVWRTKRAATIRVVLRKTSGRIGRYTPPMELVGTPDHKVLLADCETWRALGELKSGDRLCSMYRRESGGWRTLLHWTGSGWVKMGGGRGARCVSEQQFVCGEVNGGRPSRRHEAHHINDNPYDHSADNLEWKVNGVHQSEHTRERNLLGLAGWKVSGRHPRGMLGKKHTKATKRKMAAASKKMNAERRVALDAFYATTEGKQIIQDRRNKRRKNNSDWARRNRRNKTNHEVVRIEDAGVRDVFDVNVPGAHSFVANGVVVHNSGKSAMVDALVWCLFGKTLRGYEHDEVIHRKVGDGCVVTVDLDDGPGPGSVYRVGRARRHPEHKNSLWLSCDGGDVSRASEKDTQLLVERTLGCSFKTFLSSVVFGQDRAYRFSSLTDAEQKKILDEVLGVERFALGCAAARKRASSVQADLDVLRRDLARAEASRDEADVDARSLTTKDGDFARAQAAKVEAEEGKLRKVKAHLNKARRFRDADALKESLAAAQAAVTACDRKLAKAAESETAAKVEHGSAARRLAEVEDDLKRGALKEVCPACGQKIDAKKRAKIAAELEARRAEAEEKVTTAEAVLGGAAAATKHARAKLDEARGVLKAAQETYSQEIEATADAAAWRQRAKDHEARLAELRTEVNPYAALAAKARTKHAKHAKEAETIARGIVDLETQLGHAQFWVKAFGNSGLRSLLVDSSLPLLNQEAARVSRALTGGAIAVEFSATSEQKSGKVVDKFEVRVDNRHGAGTYAGNSAGERAKVDLCVGLALQRLVASRSSASFNLAVYDEVFDHLSPASHERAIDVLSTLDKESVLVISHNDDLKSWFPSSWRMVKRGDFSAVDT